LSGDIRRMVRGMLGAQKKQGIDDVAWDTRHGMEARYDDERFRFSDPLAMVAELGWQGGLSELQINLSGEEDVMNLLEKGLASTYHGDMLAAAVGTIATSDPLLVVTEVDPCQIKGDVAEGHRRLVGIISDLLPATE